MGWDPGAVDRCSRWQFVAAWRGWKRANTVDQGPKYPSYAEHERNVARARELG
jgi:hypothetical protein